MHICRAGNVTSLYHYQCGPLAVQLRITKKSNLGRLNARTPSFSFKYLLLLLFLLMLFCRQHRSGSSRHDGSSTIQMLHPPQGLVMWYHWLKLLWEPWRVADRWCSSSSGHLSCACRSVSQSKSNIMISGQGSDCTAPRTILHTCAPLHHMQLCECNVAPTIG